MEPSGPTGTCPALADVLSLASMLAAAPIPIDLAAAAVADGEWAVAAAALTQAGMGGAEAPGLVRVSPEAVAAAAALDAADPSRAARLAELRALAWDLLADRLSHAMDSPTARAAITPYLPHAEALARAALGAGDALPLDLMATYRDAVGDLRDAAAAWRDLFMKVRPPRRPVSTAPITV